MDIHFPTKNLGIHLLAPVPFSIRQQGSSKLSQILSFTTKPHRKAPIHSPPYGAHRHGHCRKSPPPQPQITDINPKFKLETGHPAGLLSCAVLVAFLNWFHGGGQQCASLSSIPRGKWYCKYCQNMFQREKFVEHNANVVAAGRVLGVDFIEQITKRCIRIVKNPEDAEYRMKSVPVVDLGERKIDIIITRSAVIHMLEECVDYGETYGSFTTLDVLAKNYFSI
ncbi:hypothetical protein CsSME_00051347 [Camellia sinensis var. sinensis]